MTGLTASDTEGAPAPALLLPPCEVSDVLWASLFFLRVRGVHFGCKAGVGLLSWARDVPSGYRYFRSASSMVQRTIPVTGKATIIVATILYAGRCDEVAAVREIGIYRRMREMAVMSAYVVRGRVMRLLVGLHLARVWLRQRIAVGSIWRQIRLLMLKMTEWRWNYPLFQWKTTNVRMFLFF
jgi:hypothetical protein